MIFTLYHWRKTVRLLSVAYNGHFQFNYNISRFYAVLSTRQASAAWCKLISSYVTSYFYSHWRKTVRVLSVAYNVHFQFNYTISRFYPVLSTRQASAAWCKLISSYVTSSFNSLWTKTVRVLSVAYNGHFQFNYTISRFYAVLSTQQAIFILYDFIRLFTLEKNRENA